MQSRRKINIESNSTQSTVSSKGSNGRNNKLNNITSNNYQRIDKKKESNTPYKIEITTRYDKCRKPTGEITVKNDTKSQTHVHILTREERQKYGKGLRPSAAQREFDAYNKLDNKTKDSMIEIIDKTKYPLENNNIKLKPNKVTLINKKKIVVQNDPRQKYSRGIREKKEEIIGQIEVNEKPSRIRNINNNQNQNKEIQLISNKRIVIRNKKPLSPLPGTRGGNPPINYDSKRNLTKKVEKNTTRINMYTPDTDIANKNSLRHNTVSHKIVNIKRGEPKPYVLNERKTDIISFRPNALRKYSFSNNWDDVPLKSDKNHSVFTTRNVTKEYKTVADLPPTKKIHHHYNISHDPNLKNTGSHKIDATKKEPKKEVVVHPRKLTVIKSVIPSRRHLTETNNDNSGQKKNQNLFVTKYETDKKEPKNLDKKFNIVRENKYYQQKPQTQPNLYQFFQPKQKIENKINIKDNTNTRINRRINNNEPKKETTNVTNITNTNRYYNPTRIAEPQVPQQAPSTQNTRIRRDYQKPIEKPSENKNQPKINTYISKYQIKAPQIQPQSTKPNQPTLIRPPVQTNKYTSSNTQDVNKYSTKYKPYQISSQQKISSNNYNTYSQPINRRQEKNLDNNDVKQIVYKKDSNTSNNTNKDKAKNYVVSNIGFVQNNNNNGFVISKANKSTNSTAINYNVNKNEKKEDKNEIKKENKDIKNEEIITKIDVKIEPKLEEPQKPKEETVEKEQEQEQKEEPEEQQEVEEENEEIQNNENIEDKEEQIKIESPVEQHEEKQENINVYIDQNNQPEPETEKQNIEDNKETKEEILSDENPNINIEININKEEQNNEEINPENKEEENNEQINIEEQEQEPEKEQIEQNENLISNENMNINMNNIENEEEGEEGEEQIENVEVIEKEEGNYQQQNEVEGEGEEEQNENENGEEHIDENENGEEYINININQNENGEENGEEYVHMNEEEENGENYEEEVGEEEIQEIDGGEEDEVEGEEDGDEEGEDDNEEQ